MSFAEIANCPKLSAKTAPNAVFSTVLCFIVKARLRNEFVLYCSENRVIRCLIQMALISRGEQ